MAYTEFDGTKPDPATQSISQFGSSTRGNDLALMDQLIALGQLPGWDYSVTGGTTAKPTQVTYTFSASIKVRVNMTYDASDRMVTMKAQKTIDGTNWDDMSYGGKDTATFSYDGSGYLSAVTWSAT